ncbi:hypothetical protein VPH35_009330 [Triticum aestivum]
MLRSKHRSSKFSTLCSMSDDINALFIYLLTCCCCFPIICNKYFISPLLQYPFMLAKLRLTSRSHNLIFLYLGFCWSPTTNGAQRITTPIRVTLTTGAAYEASVETRL